MGKTQIAMKKWNSLGVCGSRWGDRDIQHESDRKVPAQQECGIWRRPGAAAGGELRGQLAGRNPAMCVPASSLSATDHVHASFSRARAMSREAGEEWERGSAERHVSWLPSFPLSFFFSFFFFFFFSCFKAMFFVLLALLAKIDNQVRCGGGFCLKTEITFSHPAGNSWLWVVACHQLCQF